MPKQSNRTICTPYHGADLYDQNERQMDQWICQCVFLWENQGMAWWRRIVRAAALVLLLIAATDILVVDTAFASACSSNATKPGSTESSTSGPGDDDCYCCCTHIVLTNSPKLVFTKLVEAIYFNGVPSSPKTEPKPILHPPRST